jgi:hypothetical protein
VARLPCRRSGKRHRAHSGLRRSGNSDHIYISISVAAPPAGGLPMSRYCIWFVSADDSVMRRAEVVINGVIHGHMVLEEIEAQLARDCGLSQVMIVDWKRFESPDEDGGRLARVA